MTQPRLHVVPSTGSVMLEQIRALGLRMRTVGVLLLSVFAILAIVTVKMALNVRDLNATRTAHSQMMNTTFSARVSVVFAAIALLVPVLVWEGEDVSRRLYHRAMPVAQPLHAFLKAFGGWIWLQAAVAVILTGVVVVSLVVRGIIGGQDYDPHFTWWVWLVPFTASTVTYTYASACAVGSRQPFVLIFGMLLVYGSTMGLLGGTGIPAMESVAHAMRTVITGEYGLGAAAAGTIDRFDAGGRYTYPSLARWLTATSLWGVGLGAAFYAVAQWRSDVS